MEQRIIVIDQSGVIVARWTTKKRIAFWQASLAWKDFAEEVGLDPMRYRVHLIGGEGEEAEKGYTGRSCLSGKWSS